MSGSVQVSPGAHFIRRLLPAYWIFLFTVTHFPKLGLPGRIPQSDKIVHLVAYGLLALLLWRFVMTFTDLSPRFVYKALALIAAYAAFDEMTQPLVGRSADIWDWFADVVGAGLVLAVLEWRRQVVARRGATSGVVSPTTSGGRCG